MDERPHDRNIEDHGWHEEFRVQSRRHREGEKGGKRNVAVKADLVVARLRQSKLPDIDSKRQESWLS